jgi:hypothetical protein
MKTDTLSSGFMNSESGFLLTPGSLACTPLKSMVKILSEIWGHDFSHHNSSQKEPPAWLTQEMVNNTHSIVWALFVMLFFFLPSLHSRRRSGHQRQAGCVPGWSCPGISCGPSHHSSVISHFTAKMAQLCPFQVLKWSGDGPEGIPA